MSIILLNQWDAVELFCKVLCEFDHRLRLKDFKNNTFLIHQLSKYSSEKNHSLIAEAVFSKTGGSLNNYAKSFYQLGRKIRNSLQVDLNNDEFDIYCVYIKDMKFKLRKIDVVTWIPVNKQRTLEGKKFILYYYHKLQEENKKAKVVSGIAKSILKLDSFGKAELVGCSPNECYEGNFVVHGEEKFLSLSMKLKKYNSKDLHIIFYIGTGDIELALGKFNNVGRSIYAGTLMIQSIKDKDIKSNKPWFFKNDEMKDLPDHVQKYFKKKSQNILRVPCEITSLSDFYDWHKRKNPDDYDDLEVV